jgi:hypothetical protein
MSKTSMKSWLKNGGAAALLALAGVLSASPAMALDDKKADENSSEAKPAQTGSKLDQYDEKLSNNPDDPSAKVVFLIDISGGSSIALSVTPLKRLIEAAKRVQPDYIVLRINSSNMRPGLDPSLGLFDGTVQQAIDRTVLISNMLGEELRTESGWTKKPELIAYVNKAIGPSALLPFMCKRIYFTSNAEHGGIGYLENYLRGRADLVVLEKWRGMSRALAEGIAIKGGHDPRILRAMLRMDYTLSFTMVGGKPDFYEDLSGQEVLTDDGDPDAGRADLIDDLARGRGNDLLVLRPDVAQRIGFINGVAPTFDDLMFELGTQRAYRTYTARSKKIISEWTAEFNKIGDSLLDLMRKYEEVEVNGQTPSERNQQRSRAKRLLQDRIDLVNRYREIVGEVRDPRDERYGMVGDVDDYIADLRAEIAQIDQAIRMDRLR